MQNEAPPRPSSDRTLPAGYLYLLAAAVAVTAVAVLSALDVDLPNGLYAILVGIGVLAGCGFLTRSGEARLRAGHERRRADLQKYIGQAEDRLSMQIRGEMWRLHHALLAEPAEFRDALVRARIEEQEALRSELRAVLAKVQGGLREELRAALGHVRAEAHTEGYAAGYIDGASRPDRPSS